MFCFSSVKVWGTIIHGLASFMALAGFVQLVAGVGLGISDASGLPPPETQKTENQRL